MAKLEWNNIEAKSTPEPNTGCWLWLRAIADTGYGQIGHRGKVLYAHRVSWERANGPIPPKMVVDHKCRVRACVNPDHLRVVTHRENTMCGTNPSAAKARQTHCLRGHEFTESNTARTRRGTRSCRACWKVRRLLAEAGVEVE